MWTLVTGANGFVGATLCRKLTERGNKVRGLVRKTSDLSLLEGIPIHLVVGSMEDPPSLLEAVKDTDVVYHLASKVTDWGPLSHFRQINVEGTRNLLEASIQTKVKRFVYISSVAVHSFIGAQDMDENSPQLPTPFPYCQSKREAEALVMEYHRTNKIKATIARPGDIFGPGDRITLLKMDKLLRKGKIAYVGGGKTLGAFTYVENLVDGLILLGIKNKALGQAYVITDGIKLTWREYFEKLTDALNFPQPKYSINSNLAYVMAAILEHLYHLLHISSRPPITRYLITHLRKDFHFSIKKAQDELGYSPKININTAIRRTAQWYHQWSKKKEK